MKAKSRISALFEFNSYGALKGIYLNAIDEDDQQVLQKGLSSLLRPEKFSSLKRLFMRCQNR